MDGEGTGCQFWRPRTILVPQDRPGSRPEHPVPAPQGRHGASGPPGCQSWGIQSWRPGTGCPRWEGREGRKEERELNEGRERRERRGEGRGEREVRKRREGRIWTQVLAPQDHPGAQSWRPWAVRVPVLGAQSRSLGRPDVPGPSGCQSWGTQS